MKKKKNKNKKKKKKKQALRIIVWERTCLLTGFEVHTVSNGPRFFPFDLWPKREAQYGPRRIGE